MTDLKLDRAGVEKRIKGAYEDARRRLEDDFKDLKRDVDTLLSIEFRELEEKIGDTITKASAAVVFDLKTYPGQRVEYIDVVVQGQQWHQMIQSIDGGQFRAVVMLFRQPENAEVKA